MKLSTIILSLFVLFSIKIGNTQEANSQSPYFALNGDKNAENFPLLSNKAKVTISGPIADVKIQQVYKNESNSPIEAIYVFPASTQAAVYHMEMHIGERVLKAEIQRKEEARKTYNNAKKEGKRTSLLEQHKPNVFQMNVANIMPGDEIEVYLYYTEFIVPEKQEYTFHYPTVVGPRYTGENPSKWASQPYTKKGVPPTYTFDLEVKFNTPVPVQELHSTSHKIIVDDMGKSQKLVTLSSSEYSAGNKDFILKYRLSNNQIATGIQTYSNGTENYFLCQMEAPQIKTNPEIVPREYIFIMDVSGSMNGFPMDVSKNLMHKLFATMKPTDRFNILFFAGSAFALSNQSLDATPNNVTHALKMVDLNKGSGGTNMLNAIKKAMQFPKDEDFSRSFIIITDGYVTVEEKAFQYIKNNLNQANFFAFGIGSSVNRHLIEGVAHAGKGKPFIVTKNSEAQKVAEQLKAYVETPMLASIKVKTKGVEIYDVVPSAIPDLMGERPIYIFGKFRNANNASITIEGMKGCNRFVQELAFPESDDELRNLEYLWARESIKHLEFQNYFSANQDNVKRITELGLNHNLLTEFTSFVAVDDEVVNQEGEMHEIKQPLPLPEGVSNYAVGFEMEIPDLGYNHATNTMDVNIISHDKILKHSIETILEILLKKPEFLNIVNKEQQFHFHTDKNGKVICEDLSIPSAFMEALNAHLSKTGMKFINESFILTIERVKH